MHRIPHTCKNEHNPWARVLHASCDAVTAVPGIGMSAQPCKNDAHITNGVDSYVFFTIGPNLKAGAALHWAPNIKKNCSASAVGVGWGSAALVTNWMTSGRGHSAMEGSQPVKGVLVGMLPGPK